MINSREKTAPSCVYKRLQFAANWSRVSSFNNEAATSNSYR